MDDEARRAYEDGLLEEALRDSIARWLRGDGNRPGEPFDILAWAPVLWTGWADDHAVAVYRMRNEDRPRLFVADQIGMPADGRLLGALEAKADGYKRVAARTREFVRKARAEGLG